MERLGKNAFEFGPALNPRPGDREVGEPARERARAREIERARGGSPAAPAEIPRRRPEILILGRGDFERLR
jgi:hypothetical protein